MRTVIRVAVKLADAAAQQRGGAPGVAAERVREADRNLRQALGHALVDAHGKPVLLVVADAARYLGTRRKEEAQPELPLAEAAAPEVPATEQKVDEEAELSEETRHAHWAQGGADARQGFSLTRNPWPEGTRAYASYHAGWLEGEAERRANREAPTTSGKRRRQAPDTRANGPEANP